MWTNTLIQMRNFVTNLSVDQIKQHSLACEFVKYRCVYTYTCKYDDCVQFVVQE